MSAIQVGACAEILVMFVFFCFAIRPEHTTVTLHASFCLLLTLNCEGNLVYQVAPFEEIGCLDQNYF